MKADKAAIDSAISGGLERRPTEHLRGNEMACTLSRKIERSAFIKCFLRFYRDSRDFSS